MEVSVGSTWAMGTTGCKVSRASSVWAGVIVVSAQEDATSPTNAADEDFSMPTVLGVGRSAVVLTAGGTEESVGSGVGVDVAMAA